MRFDFPGSGWHAGTRCRHIAGRGVLASLAVITVWCVQVRAHEVQPALAEVDTRGDRLSIVLETGLEAHIAGINLTEFEDTNEAPADEAAEHDSLRGLEPDALAERFEAFWPEWRATLNLEAEGGGRLDLRLDAVEAGPLGDIELQRSSTMRLSAPLPTGTTAVRFGWDAVNGPLILREAGTGDALYTGYLTNGQSGGPIAVRASGRLVGSGLFWLVATGAAVVALGAGLAVRKRRAQ